MAFVFIYGLFIHTLIVMFRIIIASQSRNIGTQFQKVENCDLVKNRTKNDKNGQNYAPSWGV